VSKSYDLVSAFLVPKLEGSFIVIRLPPNGDGSKGQVLALLVAMYGLKDAPAAFLRDQMASFTYNAQHEPVNKEAQRRKKRFEPGKDGSRDPTDSREGKCSQLLSDHCVWVYRKGEILMLILHYADDMIISSNDKKCRQAFLNHLRKKWKITESGKLSRTFKFTCSETEHPCGGKS